MNKEEQKEMFKQFVNFLHEQIKSELIINNELKQKILNFLKFKKFVEIDDNVFAVVWNGNRVQFLNIEKDNIKFVRYVGSNNISLSLYNSLKKDLKSIIDKGYIEHFFRKNYYNKNVDLKRKDLMTIFIFDFIKYTIRDVV